MVIWNFFQAQILGMKWLHDSIGRLLALLGLDITTRIGGSFHFFLYDIKLADDEKHKAYTGASNKLILENLGILIESGVPFFGRTPLIEGINDSVENLTATAELVKNAKNMLRFELLPYNGAAGGKYPMVGKEYEYPCFKAPDKIDVTPFTDRNIECRIL